MLEQKISKILGMTDPPVPLKHSNDMALKVGYIASIDPEFLSYSINW